MIRCVTLTALLALVVSSAAVAEPFQKVVSLDYCADQFVLKLLPRANILAVSPDAHRDFSYMRDAVAGLRQVRPVAEDVLALQPDLIVRSYGGGPRAVSFFERAGVPVLQVPFANNLEDIRATTLMMADRLGASERGREVVADMDSRLAAIDAGKPPRSTLYMTPNGATSGTNTLIHEMLLAANLDNFEQRPGWHSIPLERLAYAQPELVAAAFFDGGTSHPAMWSAMRHPVAQRQVSEQPTVMLQGAWTSCGGWFLVDAIEALAAR
jgi:iron complex transport system substrate-binding protein